MSTINWSVTIALPFRVKEAAFETSKVTTP
jgi:hypothetical protein